MQTHRVLFFILALSGSSLAGADIKIPAPIGIPLAVIGSPPCSQRAGIRAVRSQSVQFGSVTASISAQANRESGACLVSSALWITRNDVSEQVNLPDAARNVFGIVDIAPDASSILISAEDPGDERSVRMGLVKLRDGTVQWTKLADLIATPGKCEVSVEPSGFINLEHVGITLLPLASRPQLGCSDRPAYFSYDVHARSLKAEDSLNIVRVARVVAPMVRSCKTDPDVTGACYAERARLAYNTRGPGLLVWTIGSNRMLAVQDGMVPEELSERVTLNTRVYATMVICPLLAQAPVIRPRVCVDEATGLKPEPVAKKLMTTAAR